MTAILPGRRTRLAPSVDAGCDAFREAIRATGLEPPQEIVADGVTTADGKVEGLRTDMNRGFEDVREVMAVGFGAHDVRLRRIEGGSTA